ncbi:MAG: transglutaminase domain-containing protein [Algicola sp.]|nr:transglutaminase domain-containing protein [Algicola sp.]
MIFKKISWLFKRHPFLYKARFKLLSKNSDTSDIKNQTYNKTNDKQDIPKYFYEINDIIFKNFKPQTDLELIQHLSIWLQDNIKGGPGLSEPSDEALRIMLAGKGGVCSDIAQIFNNFCVINDVKVREWGNTRAPFSKDYGGHSFNEVYIEHLKKWILIDVSCSMLFYYDDSALSVIELYQLIREDKQIVFNSFNSKQAIDNKNIQRNYLNPNIVPFLICNYSNKLYDAYLRFFRPYVPVFIIHFIIFSLGKSYHYRFPIDNYKKIFA